jgi:3-methyladenine DNA glycosylase AlkD
MQASFQILPSTLEKQLVYIKKNIYLHKNGIVSESMEAKGIRYGLNYGVSIPDLKQLADTLPHDAILAQRLWDEDIRETKLLATLLYPTEIMNEKKAITWLKDIHNIELAEQTTRNLFSKSPDAAAIASNWCQSTNSWQGSVGFMTAAYGMTTLSSDIRSIIDQQTFISSKQDTYEIYWAIALYLKKQGACNPVSANEVLARIIPFKDSPLMSERYIFEEVFTELQYRFET